MPDECAADRLRGRAGRGADPAPGLVVLSRDAARFVLRKLQVPADVRQLALDAGWQEHEQNGLGERELVRQRDLTRLVALAAELAQLDGPEFVTELERRFGDGGESRRGVHLLTLHGAKGLEFDAVFVAHVEERELPVRQAKTETAVQEERRLLRRPHARAGTCGSRGRSVRRVS